jgi:hypothetical protein
MQTLRIHQEVGVAAVAGAVEGGAVPPATIAGLVALARAAVKAPAAEPARAAGPVIAATVVAVVAVVGNSAMEQESKYNKTLLGVIAAGVLIIGMLVLAGLNPSFLYNTAERLNLLNASQKEVATAQQISAGKQSAWNGDYMSAASDVGAVVEAGDTSNPYFFSAIVLYAESKWQSAKTADDRVAAMRLFIRYFDLAEQYPVLQANAVNRIATALYASGEQAVIDTVAQQEPFSSMRIPGDNYASMKNVIEYSLSIYPTYDAHLLLARLEADAVLSGLVKGSTALLKNTPEVRIQMEERVSKIVSEVAAADALYVARQPQFTQSSPFNVTTDAWYYFWRGQVLAAAARIDSQYAALAEQSFDAAITSVEMQKDDSGAPYTILLPVTARTELAYARLLHDVGGSEQDASVRRHLSVFVQIVTGAQSDMVHDLISFFDQTKDGALVTGSEWSQVSLRQSYDEYVALANISPELKQFLISRGWRL